MSAPATKCPNAGYPSIYKPTRVPAAANCLWCETAVSFTWLLIHFPFDTLFSRYLCLYSCASSSLLVCLPLCASLPKCWWLVFGIPFCLHARRALGNEPLRCCWQQEGDGLPDMITPTAVDKALVASGFEIVETRDAALDPNPGGIPWYQPLTPSWNVFTQRFQFNWLGLRLTKAALFVMEMVRVVFRCWVVSLSRNSKRILCD